MIGVSIAITNIVANIFSAPTISEAFHFLRFAERHNSMYVGTVV